jgi:dihydropteroate synthase
MNEHKEEQPLQAMKLPSGAVLDFSGPAPVMAIVNCNDDSFYAPSRSMADKAVEQALAAAEAGATIIDFGAESTRPGASYVSAEEELERLVPVIGAFRKRSPLAVSVDTRKALVAKAVLDAGGDMINDISALEDDPQMGKVCAEYRAAVILMHKKGVPQDMQDNPWYEDVVAELTQYLLDAAHRAEAQGIARERIILDPGIGFGKRLEDNLDIISRLGELCGKQGRYPVLMALSRKSFIGQVTGRDVFGRLAGTIAANAISLMAGAALIRVHDVPEAVDLVKIVYAVQQRLR